MHNLQDTFSPTEKFIYPKYLESTLHIDAYDMKNLKFVNYCFLIIFFVELRCKFKIETFRNCIYISIERENDDQKSILTSNFLGQFSWNSKLLWSLCKRASEKKRFKVRIFYFVIEQELGIFPLLFRNYHFVCDSKPSKIMIIINPFRLCSFHINPVALCHNFDLSLLKPVCLEENGSFWLRFIPNISIFFQISPCRKHLQLSIVSVTISRVVMVRHGWAHQLPGSGGKWGNCGKALGNEVLKANYIMSRDYVILILRVTQSWPFEPSIVLFIWKNK